MWSFLTRVFQKKYSKQRKEKIREQAVKDAAFPQNEGIRQFRQGGILLEWAELPSAALSQVRPQNDVRIVEAQDGATRSRTAQDIVQVGSAALYEDRKKLRLMVCRDALASLENIGNAPIVLTPGVYTIYRQVEWNENRLPFRERFLLQKARGNR